MDCDQKCCDCDNLDRSQKTTSLFSSTEKYKCKKTGDYYELNHPKCSGFENKKTDGYTPAGCYIVTITCEVLGYGKDCELSTIMHTFGSILKTNPNYLPLFKEYDKVGPVISNNISAREDKYPLCLGILVDYLIPCVTLIKEGNYAQALIVYIDMVLRLQEEFNLDMMDIDLEPYYNDANLGKGRSRNIASV